MPQAISIEEVKDAPWGSIKAAKFQPDGMTFDTPALLAFKISDGDLPHGVKKESLRVAALEGGAWKILGGSRFDPEAGAVSAPIKHFSIYGLVPEPGAISGKGTRFELNGITALTRDSVNGRLFVAPSFVSFYAEADEAAATSLTLSGLPADGEHHVYAGSHDNHHVLTSADGGAIELPLDLAGPSLVWIQPRPSTIVIGGGPGVDECASYGERTGEVCTLTADVVGDIELRSGALDCGGHSITQHAAYGGSGIGVFVPLDTYGAVIENCMIGSSAGNFAYGMEILGADTAVVSGNNLTDNIIGVLLQGTNNSFVSDNQIGGASLWAVALWGSSLGNEVSGNAIDVDNDAITIEGLVGAPSSSSGNRVLDNMVTRAAGGILLARTRGNTVMGNDISGVLTALLVGAGGWPSTVYWNDFHGWSRWGVWSDVGPADISDGAGHGNWWGHSCPGPLFTPGVDSNRVDVVDSYPYGEANAWRTGKPPGCGPSAPIFLLPAKGEVTTERSPAIIGIALPYARVYIYEGFSMIGEGIAQENSLFEIFPDLRMEEGEHTLHAIATDEMGISSPPSEPRTFSIVASPGEAPLYGMKGKMKIMDLHDDPDPMNPIADISLVEASIRVDGVKGLAGKSKNHVFLATMEREILSPVDGSRVQVVKGSAPLVAVEGENPPSFVSRVAAGWDGKGADGRPVMENLTYPYNVVLKVIRLYTGKGKGPGCSRDETAMEDESGKEACLIDAIELPRAGSTSILPVTTWNYDPELIPYDLDMPLSLDTWSMLFEEYKLFRLPARLIDYFRWAFFDTDGDTLINMNDNCPGVDNEGQENADGDRLGDVCDNCPNNEEEIYYDQIAPFGPCERPRRAHDFEFIDMNGCGCDDSDKGMVPYREGIVYREIGNRYPFIYEEPFEHCVWPDENFEPLQDQCLAGGILRERVCGVAGAGVVEVDCPYGCSGGKCLCEEAETDGGDNRWVGGSIGDYRDHCDPDSVNVVEYVAVTSARGDRCDVTEKTDACPFYFPCEPSIDACGCGDTDNRDIFVLGSAFGENAWGSPDRCEDEMYLIETYSDVPEDGVGCRVRESRWLCRGGCIGGRCLCMDTDQGYNPAVKGFSQFLDEEHCDPLNRILYEFDPVEADGGCDYDRTVEVNCPYACLDGRCIVPDPVAGIPTERNTMKIACVGQDTDVGSWAGKERYLDLLCSKGLNTFVKASNAWEHVNVELDSITDEFFYCDMSTGEGVVYCPRYLVQWGRNYHTTKGERRANFYVSLVKMDEFPPPAAGAMGYGSHICFDHMCLASQAALVLYGSTPQVMAHELSHLFRYTVGGETYVLCEEYLAEECPDRLEHGYNCYNPSPRSGASCDIRDGNPVETGDPSDLCDYCIMSKYDANCTKFAFCSHCLEYFSLAYQSIDWSTFYY